jgi:transposase
MRKVERTVAMEARAMTKAQVIVRAIERRITWIQAATILGVTDRHMRRLKTLYERQGYDGIRDGRAGTPRRKRIPVKTIEEICRLKRESYADFSVQHFHEHITEKHKFEISYTWTRLMLQEAVWLKRRRRAGNTVVGARGDP